MGVQTSRYRAVEHEHSSSTGTRRGSDRGGGERACETGEGGVGLRLERLPSMPASMSHYKGLAGSVLPRVRGRRMEGDLVEVRRNIAIPGVYVGV